VGRYPVTSLGQSGTGVGHYPVTSLPLANRRFYNILYLRFATSVVCVTNNQPSKSQPASEASCLMGQLLGIKKKLDF
jgi:hypothetical protein